MPLNLLPALVVFIATVSFIAVLFGASMGTTICDIRDAAKFCIAVLELLFTPVPLVCTSLCTCAIYNFFF